LFYFLDSITGDFLFAENTNSIPPNRTVNPDSLPPVYRQTSVPSPSPFSYQSNAIKNVCFFLFLSKFVSLKFLYLEYSIF